MLKHIGGRKAAAAITVLGIGLSAVLVKGDIPPGLLQLLEAVFGAFVVGNVGSKMVAVSRAKVDSPSPAEDLEIIGEYIASKLNSTGVVEPSKDYTPELANIANGLMTVQQLLQLIIRRTGIDKIQEPPTS